MEMKTAHLLQGTKNIYSQILARQEEIPQKTSKNISQYFRSSFQGHV